MSVIPRTEEPRRGSGGAAHAEATGAASEPPGAIVTRAASRSLVARWRALSPRARQMLADAALLLVTLIWGATFVMVKDAVAAYPVFGFLGLRFVFAALALLPLLLLRRGQARGALREAAGLGAAGPWHGRPALVGPLLIGLALFAGYGFQTSGLHLTTPAHAGFITGLAVVLVPLAAALLLRQPPGLGAWLGVGFATGGLALLSWQPGQPLNPGDLLVFGCALAFAAHVLLTGRFASRVDPLWLTLGQIITVAVLCGLTSLFWETRPPLTLPVVGAAVFTGVLATSAAFGTQTLAQRFTMPTHTALIFAAEPVFAALFSFLLIGEALGPRQLLGCALILTGMLAAELKH